MRDLQRKPTQDDVELGSPRPETWNKDKKLEGTFPKPPVEHRDKHSILDKIRLGLRTKTGKTIGTLTLAGVLAGGIAWNQNGSSAEAPANPDKDTSAPAKAGEVSESGEKEVALPEFGLSAEQYQNNPEALARTYYEQHNELLVAGINKKVATSEARFFKADGEGEFIRDQDGNRVPETDEEYIFNIANPMMETYIDALFAPGWQDNPELSDYVETLREIAYDTKLVRLKTYPDDSGDKYNEAYERVLHADKIVGTVNPLTTSTTWYESDNGDASGANERIFTDTSIDPNSQTGGETFTWVNIDGKLKISSISHYDG